MGNKKLNELAAIFKEVAETRRIANIAYDAAKKDMIDAINKAPYTETNRYQIFYANNEKSCFNETLFKEKHPKLFTKFLHKVDCWCLTVKAKESKVA